MRSMLMVLLAFQRPGDVRYVVVVEPVVRVELKAALDNEGKMMWGDEAFLQRFGKSKTICDI